MGDWIPLREIEMNKDYDWHRDPQFLEELRKQPGAPRVAPEEVSRKRPSRATVDKLGLIILGVVVLFSFLLGVVVSELL